MGKNASFEVGKVWGQMLVAFYRQLFLFTSISLILESVDKRQSNKLNLHAVLWLSIGFLIFFMIYLL